MFFCRCCHGAIGDGAVALLPARPRTYWAKIVGTWKRTATARLTTIAVTPFAPITASVDAAFARYGRFLATPVEVTRPPLALP